MLSKVLIANRGEIAVRIAATLRRMEIRSVAVYTSPDGGSRHVAAADEAVCLGDEPGAYLNGKRILEVAAATGAQAVHPGYGFLSENADFAGECERAGIAFAGPTPQQIRSFGLKHVARDLARECGVPLTPGSGLLENAAHAVAQAERLGYPVMLKSSAGGGGIGMRRCASAAEVEAGFAAVERLGVSHFDDARIFVEKCIERARHVEVQIFGDGRGRVVSLGERDCSLQRRNQKVVEETPAPVLSPARRKELEAAAVQLGERVQYRSAGTVEFVYDLDADEFYFLEVNTRLQVEHPVTELVTGIDLVEWMILMAGGETPPLERAAEPRRGAAVEVRIYAENSRRDFQPNTGVLQEWSVPDGIRCDSWVERGTQIGVHYDPMLAKVIAHGETRDEAVQKLATALEGMRVSGVETNVDFAVEALRSPEFLAGTHTTRTLESFPFRGRGIEVIEAGAETSVQDWPGRLGYWAIGVPPSGPMDDVAFRLGNRLVGNPEGAPGLEITLQGPTLRFHEDTLVAVTGADLGATLDDRPVAPWTSFEVRSGSVLRFGAVRGAGCRAYLLVAGGLDVPKYLGSRSTFMLGRFGGHAGRVLRPGDLLRLNSPGTTATPRTLDSLPQHTSAWRIGVLYGPHGAPDFFTEGDINAFFAAEWKVHYNSNRTGIRLVGPKPKWARPDGGEAGLHPSNIHDNEYAVGTVDFTGDMPIVLGKDGPSLGGFVCPATVAEAELWKLGQLKAGDTVQFVGWTHSEARAAKRAQNRWIASLDDAPLLPGPRAHAPSEAVLAELPAPRHAVGLTVRRAGDRYVLLEYGPNVLDLALRFRVQVLMDRLAECNEPGIDELAPGVRSLQVRYDPEILPLPRLLDLLLDVDAALPDTDEIELPTRVLHLPLSWEDPATLLAIERYTRSVRPDAPWCPSNIEFIRRINGLQSVEDVRRIVYDATYLVLGLGDVYLGAPVATPLDPRHRLVTTKYNPARTWTPENAVGIGGAYLCIYGMEGPGGYQFVGRTVQVWNPHRTTHDFAAGRPWLLRFFDQIRFYPIDAEELLRYREAFLQGRVRLEIEEKPFRFGDYRAFLRDNAESIESFRRKQKRAFEEERARWAASGQLIVADEPAAPPAAALEVPPGCVAVESPIPGVLWKRVAEVGARVAKGDLLLILEAMKAETEVRAAVEGEIVAVGAGEGDVVEVGQVLAAIRPGAELAS